MPNPTQPMNEEELRYKVQEIIQDFHDTLDNGSGHHSIVYAAKEVVKVILADRDAAIREAQAEKPSIHVFDTWLSIDMGAEIRFEPVGMWGQRVWQNGGTYVCSGKKVNEDKTSITDQIDYRFTKIGEASYGTGDYKDVFIRGKDIKKWIEDGAIGDLKNYQGWFTLQSQPNAKEGE